MLAFFKTPTYLVVPILPVTDLSCSAWVSAHGDVHWSSKQPPLLKMVRVDPEDYIKVCLRGRYGR